MISIIVDREMGMAAAEGHAGAGAKGTDIVCAAVSVLMDMLGREAVQKHDGRVEEDDGLMSIWGYGFRYLSVLDAVVRELHEIAGKYPDKVRITEEEHRVDTWDEWLKGRR